jgi:hypothetical protein
MNTRHSFARLRGRCAVDDFHLWFAVGEFVVFAGLALVFLAPL